MTNRTDKRTLSIRALLVDEITKQLGGIRDEVKKVADQTEKANNRAAKSWAAVKKAAAAVAAIYAGLKIAQFASEIVAAGRAINQQVDELVAVARATGETIENLSELRFAFQEAGGNAEQFRAVMSSLAAAQGAALEGAQRQIDAFARLGVEVDDLRGKNPIDVFRAMAGGITDLNEGSEQYLELVKLFPEQWRNVINLIGDGSAAFQTSLEQARRAGATITSEQARAAVRSEKAFRSLQTAIESVSRLVIVEFEPAVTKGIDRLTKALLSNKDSIKDIAAATVQAISGLSQVAIDVAQFVASIPKGLEKTLADFAAVADGFTLGFFEFERKSTSAPSPRLTALNDQIADVQRGIDALNSSIARRRDRGVEPSSKRLDILDRETQKLRELQELRIAELPANEQFIYFSERARNAVRRFFDELNGAEQPAATGIAASVQQSFRTFEQLREEMVRRLRASGVPKSDAEQAGKEIGEAINKGAQPKLTVDLPRTFSEGFEESIKRLRGELNRFDATVGAAFGSVATRAVDGLANSIAGVITGAQSMREAFRQWGVSTLQMIAQVIARLLVLRTISLFTGGGSVDVGGGGGGTASAASLQASPAALGGSGAAAVYLGPSPAAGGARNVNVNVYAWDSRDAAEGLVANRETIRSLVSDDLSSHRGFRQSVQKGAR
ncbi:MAG: hypothetical protein ACE37K_11180 [Planctomycetota bacterium]